jgi:hypothetical protein
MARRDLRVAFRDLPSPGQAVLGQVPLQVCNHDQPDRPTCENARMLRLWRRCIPHTSMSHACRIIPERANSVRKWGQEMPRKMGGDTPRCQHQALAGDHCDWRLNAQMNKGKKRKEKRNSLPGERTQEDKGGAKWCRIGKKIRTKTGREENVTRKRQGKLQWANRQIRKWGHAKCTMRNWERPT